MVHSVSDSIVGEPIRTSKRKDAGVDPTDHPAKRTRTSQKRAKKSKPFLDQSVDVEAHINHAFSQMDSQLTADYMAQRTKDFEPDLSLIELNDKFIPATTIQDTTSWRKARNLENLKEFLEEFSIDPTRSRSSPQRNGAPHTIVVTAAGLRAADIARTLRAFQTKDAKVAKLFAKHIKLKEARKFLQSTGIGFAVGTPTRLIDLMESGALLADDLEMVVLDVSYVDQKKRGLLDMRETQVPLVKWLRRDLREHIDGDKKRNPKLLFY